MSKTILSEVQGFVPLIDSITQQHGVIVSAVFGRIWRYCQMETGVCSASLETIADELRLSYATVQKHVKLLVKESYLEDKTPDLRNHPHIYKDTGRAGIAIDIFASENLEGTRENLEGTREKTASHSLNFIDEDSIEFKIEGGEKDLFQQAQILTGLLALANDMPTLVKWEQSGVIADDIRSALAWRKENKRPPIKYIAQLNGGVETSRLQRIQNGNAQSSKSGNERNSLDL